MRLIDGKAVAEEIKNTLRQDVVNYKSESGRVPHLAAILVGENPASKSYVGSKVKSCEQVGFKSTLVKMDENTTEEELLNQIDKLNNDPDIDGFIVQLPLPKHIDEVNVTLAIDYKKDVDGFHPVNFGRMAQGLACYLPATPYGITLLFERYNIETAGKHVVVVGRSNIVGTPISILLSRKSKIGDATVTLAHSKTKDLQGLLLKADIIIAAIGIPGFIKEDMVTKGCVVIDVGINRIEDEKTSSGSRLVGDVDFESVKDKCSYITPVPGGVGPMTVMSLLLNTMKSARKEIYK